MLTYIKKKLQYEFARAAKRRAFVFQIPQHGIEDILDIRPFISPTGTLLDVGANIGQTAIRFRAAFPKARIVSVEPIAATFTQLQESTRSLQIECYNVALGAKCERATMYLTQSSVTNSLVRPPEGEICGKEDVEVVTLDQFVERHAIGVIDLLKIDAEGFDLEVITGGSAMLSKSAVKNILVEVGFHPGDQHALFDDVRDALAKYGFRVFGIYGQQLKWTGEPSLWFANAMFSLEPSDRY
jgi:FkbM family methyltransferase